MLSSCIDLDSHPALFYYNPTENGWSHLTMTATNHKYIHNVYRLVFNSFLNYRTTSPHSIPRGNVHSAEPMEGSCEWVNFLQVPTLKMHCSLPITWHIVLMEIYPCFTACFKQASPFPSPMWQSVAQNNNQKCFEYHEEIDAMWNSPQFPLDVSLTVT